MKSIGKFPLFPDLSNLSLSHSLIVMNSLIISTCCIISLILPSGGIWQKKKKKKKKKEKTGFLSDRVLFSRKFPKKELPRYRRHLAHARGPLAPAAAAAVAAAGSPRSCTYVETTATAQQLCRNFSLAAVANLPSATLLEPRL